MSEHHTHTEHGGREHDRHAHHAHEPEHEPLPCDGAGHEHHHHTDGSCCCHRHEEEFHGLDRVMAARLIVSAALFVCGHIFEGAEALCMAAAALIAGYDVLLAAVKNVVKGSFFDEYFLMSAACIAAFAIGEFDEGAAVMVLYRIGETCQRYAIRHSRKRMFSMPGVTSEPGGGRTERFITRFSRVYTPVVLIMALAVAVFMPVLVKETTFSESVYHALTFLVLACPCAIVISVPMAYFAGISAASKKHVFFGSSTAVDELAADKDARFEPVEAGGEHCLAYRGNQVVIAPEGGKTPENAVKIAKRTRFVARENIWFVIAVKAAVLIVSLFGSAPLWLAVFADSGVTVIAILNSLRAFRAGE